MIKRIIALLRRYMSATSSVSFWHTPIDQVIYDYPSLADYYIDLCAKCGYAGPFDDAGIPVLDYTGDIGVQYNPCACAQYALGHFQRWQRDGDDAAGARFFEIADWLCDTQALEESDTKGYWLYLFDLDAYDVDAPWKSGLAQAQAVSVLARAVKFAPDETRRATYQRALELGFAGLITPVQNGGLTLSEGDDVWIEEVVASRRVAILDGCLFALFGIRDYADLTGSEEANALFDTASRTIIRYLPTFDLGYWSRADLYMDDAIMPASHFYHNLHVHQLRAMHALTGAAAFAEYADRWDGYQASWFNRKRALFAKIAFKIGHY